MGSSLYIVFSAKRCRPAAEALMKAIFGAAWPILNSLRLLRVLCASAVSVFKPVLHRRDAQVAETTLRS